jgi:hypothetical protein
MNLRKKLYKLNIKASKSAGRKGNNSDNKNAYLTT